MLATEIASIGEVEGELLGDISSLRFGCVVGSCEISGCDGSEETLEVGELIFVGDELEDLADGLAFDQMVDEGALEIIGQQEPVGSGHCHHQPSFRMTAEDDLVGEEETIGAVDFSALFHTLVFLQIVFQGLRPWNTTQLGGTMLRCLANP